MDPDVQEKLLPELAPGEFLTWGDWAYDGLVWKESDWGRFLAGLAFTLGIGFFTYAAATSPNPVPPFARYFFLPLFQIISLYLLIGHQYFDIWKRSSTVYGLTQNRVLIVRTLFYRKVLMIDLTFPQDIIFHKRTDGRGTILFGPENFEEEREPTFFFSRRGLFLPIPRTYIVANPRRLELAEDADRVYGMIRERMNLTMKKYKIES